jgi:uncharacterized protein YbgA (DUF1722 family)/uncharacterized protein YbbK (DUF523 family)
MNKQNAITTDKVVNNISQSLIQVGLSACLAGHQVRHNGGHSQSRLCLNILSQHFTFKTFCPEVAAGFGTPRPTMRLIGDPKSPQLVSSKGVMPDLTPQLINGFENNLSGMSNLDGYILMKGSPSCGLERVKVYQLNGHPHQIRTAGLFAKALKEKYPLMPIEEEGRLHDDKLFDNFVLRVYAYSDFRREVLKQPSLHKLTTFHGRYKYILMAHNQEKCRDLGRLLGSHKNGSLEKLIHTYLESFIQTLTQPASRKNHTNTLLHILGYLKNSLPSPAKEHIVEVIYKYHKGLTPLTTPLTLLKHYLNQYGSSYIKNQRYFEPYPETMSPLIKYLS